MNNNLFSFVFIYELPRISQVCYSYFELTTFSFLLILTSSSIPTFLASILNVTKFPLYYLLYFFISFEGEIDMTCSFFRHLRIHVVIQYLQSFLCYLYESITVVRFS